MELVWRCSCPVCRATVYPLFRRMLGGLQLSEEKKGEVVEVAEEEIKKPEAPETEDLKMLVEALRNSIMELRSAISDLTSPFNLMRQAAEREELKAIREASEDTGPVPFSASPTAVPPAPQAVSPRAEVVPRREVKEAKTVEAERPREEVELEKTVAAEEARKPEIMHVEEKPRPAVFRRVSLIKATRLLRLLYTLRGRLSSHNIENLIQLLVVMGAIDEGMADTVKQLLNLVEEGMRSGLTPEDQAVIIYSLAKTLGVEDEEFEEEVASILLKRLGGGGIWGSQRQ